MSFKFNVTGSSQTAGSTKKDVDWNALNQHVVDASGTATKSRSIPGVISGIIDLGEQERPDYEEEFKGSEDERKKIVAEDSMVYFREEAGKVYKCRPQKPVQQVAITVDFPTVLVDKGQFFGESNPLPLRMVLNGEFQIDGTKVVAKPYSISEKKYDDGTWAFAKNNGLHKLAEACEILDEKGYFTKDRIGGLLGKIAQFQFRVWMKPSKKDKSKTFFTEEIKLAGVVPEGIPVPEIPEGILYGVNMTAPNDEDAIKQLRVSIRNTIKRAKNYEGSVLQAELEKHFPNSGTAKPVVEKEVEESPAPVAKEAKPKKEKAAPVVQEDFGDDEDLPF